MTRATRAGLIKFALVTGAGNSDTVGLAIAAEDGTAITLNDTIIGCVELAQTTNAPTDRTAASAIIAGGKITVPASANDVIVVWWMARDADRQVDSPFVQAAVGVGAGANASIICSGINTTDLLISVVSINDATGGAWTDRTVNSIIYAANVVRCDQSTAGEHLFVMWMDRSGPRAFSSLNLQFGLANIDVSPNTDPSSATLAAIRVGDTPLVVLCTDEIDKDALYELAVVTSVVSDGVLAIDEPSPTATLGAELWVFWQKANDLDV